MKTDDVYRQIEKLNLQGEQKSAILALIDLKTGSDMKTVMLELNKLRADMDAKFKAIETKFDTKFNSLDKKFNFLLFDDRLPNHTDHRTQVYTLSDWKIPIQNRCFCPPGCQGAFEKEARLRGFHSL